MTVTVSGAKDDFGRTGTPAAYTFVTQQPTLPAGTCPCNIWSDAAMPSTVDSGDGHNVELGVKFTPSTDGYITGIRFYKSARQHGDAHGNSVVGEWHETGDGNLHQRVDHWLGAA